MAEDYRMIADDLAADVAAGRLRPGDQLPPQRRFARDRGIAASTASRVYGELLRRGLAVGEVGRGTFIRAGEPTSGELSEPGTARVDLERNFPVLPAQSAMLAASMAGLLRPDAMADAMRAGAASGTEAARRAAAALLSSPQWTPEAGRIQFAGNGRQALAAAIAALVRPGERLGVEALTYPVVKGIAARLGVILVPLAMDEDGVVPAAVRSSGVRVVYLQPTLHNPLGVTMSARRRTELAAVLRDVDAIVIEDLVNGFLDETPTPFAAIEPERTVLVDSLSKRIAPGLSVGFLVPPVRLASTVSAALRSGGWVASNFALAAAIRWITDGTAAAIVDAKRRDARARQLIAAERLAGYDLQANPLAYHLWWRLPAPWRAETFVAAAARRAIAVSPAAAFAVSTAQAPNAVRLAMASPPLDVLPEALETLASLAKGTPEDAGIE